jgi:hypothetical protein
MVRYERANGSELYSHDRKHPEKLRLHDSTPMINAHFNALPKYHLDEAQERQIATQLAQSAGWGTIVHLSGSTPKVP